MPVPSFCLLEVGRRGVEVETLELLVGKLSGRLQQFILLLPNLAIAVIVVIVFCLLAKLAKNLSYLPPS